MNQRKSFYLNDLFLVLKRVLKIFYYAPVRRQNEKVLPGGYVVFREELPENYLNYLSDTYSFQSRDLKMPSGSYEDRAVFYDLEPISKILERPEIKSVLEKFKSPEKNPSFVMRNIISKVDEKGSGGGWHRDTFDPALKVFIPLTDSTVRNGCTEYCASSRGLLGLLKSAMFGLRESSAHFKSVGLEMRRGDFAIVDVSAIHRGTPPTTSGREMLTVYFKRAV